MKFTRKLTCLLVLAALLLSTIAIPALAASSDGNAGAYIWSKVSNNAATNRAWSREKQFEGEAQDIYKDTDTVRVSILLDEPSTMDKFGYKSSKNLSSSNAAMTYRAGLLEKQNKLAARIEKEALRGKKLDVVWNLTLAANIISANILFGEIDRIAAVKGVKGVYVENVYEMDGFDAGEAPTQSIGTAMTKTNSAWASGYTGAGSIVAIVDTGLDTTHELFDPDAFMYAIEEDWENGKEFELLDEEKLAETLPLLNLSTRGDYEASDLYLSAKIPLAFNYSENNLNVGHLNDIQSEHGTHVTSIAAGNRYVKDGNGGYAPSLEKVLTQGQAPDAQVIVIKYFSARTGTDADYFAAIEDCILLGVDSVNLSLGSSTVSGLSINRVYEEIFKKIENSDLTMVCSAGNTGSWASHLGIFSYLYSQDKNMSTGGSPGSYTTAMAVGSADNDGSTGPYIGYEGEQIFFSQTSGYGNEPISTLSGTYEFIYIDSPGTDEDFAAVADVLEGKIAVCNRGTTSFYEKANAAISNGAIATVIVNNQAGVINMNLTGYLYTNPAVSIQLADGLYIKATAEAVKDEEENILYYKGEFNLSDDIASVNYGSVNYTISSFSSWGTPGNLTLKPEIVAPGGSIYAANGRHKNEDGVTYSGGSDQYELMSGTSMASPQVAGIVATLAQYIRENNLQEKTGLSERQLALSLLMSTATPMIQDGTYYPIQQQGSGFVNAEAAVNSGTVILMGEDATAYAADGKVKAELGVIDEPKFSFSFTINNISDRDIIYDLFADFFTQDLFYYYVFNADQEAVGITTYSDDYTAFLESAVTWKVNGEEFDPEDKLIYDFNGDGAVAYNDAEVLLEYAVGNISEFNNQEYADLNEDGNIDSYDAHLVLQAINSASLYVKAGETAEIEISVELLDIDDYDDKGAYIEGFVYADEADTEDGALGVSHSIPVIGFYGDWTESSMFDHGNAIDTVNGRTELIPYMEQVIGSDAEYIKAFLTKYPGQSSSVEFLGNPVSYDEDEEGNYVYLENRNALNSDTELSSVRYTQIRNAADGRIQVTNQNGDLLYEKKLGAQYAAFYSESRGQWLWTSTEEKIQFVPGDSAAEGDVLTATLTLAPEYYYKEDGSIDWDALGEGASYSFSYTIDNTAPVIESIDMHYDTRKGGFDRLDIKATDNQYIAGVFVSDEIGWPYEIFGSNTSPDAEPGLTESYTVDFAAMVESGDSWMESLADLDKHLLVEVYDYAGNLSTYKINLDPEELNEDPELTLDAEEIRLHKGSQQKLEATVNPWGVDDAVIWTSSDDSIATVDERGVVTAVETGFATIRATSVLSEDIYAECEVEVFVLNNTIVGAVQDEDGYPLIFDWNLKEDETWNPIADLPQTFTVLTTDPLTGDLYLQDWDGYIYHLDGSTLEILEVSETPTALGEPVDGIAFPALVNYSYGRNMALGVYGGYLLTSMDIMDNTFTSGYNLGQYLSMYTGARNFVTIAWAGISSGYDVFLALDDAGAVWTFLYNGQGLRLGVANSSLNAKFSLYDNKYLCSSVVGDDEELYVAIFDGVTSNIYQLPYFYFEEIDYEYYDSLYLGDVGDDVWPAALLGVYANEEEEEEEEESGEGGDRLRTVSESFADRIAGMDLIEITSAPAPAKLALRSANMSAGPVKPFKRADEDFEPLTPNTIDLAILAVTLGLNEAATNGIIEVTYDPALVDCRLIGINADYSAANAGDGIITFAFANHEAAEAGTNFASVMVMPCDALKEAGYTEIKVTYKQLNDEYPETEEIFPIGTPAPHIHSYPDEAEWTWSEDHSFAAATLTCEECEESITLIAAVEAETTPATYEAAGKTVYTATVELDGKTYTDTFEEEIPALEYTYLGIAITWAEDNTAKAFVTRNDGEEIEIEVNLSSETKPATHEADGWTLYTATATYGELYASDTKLVTLPAEGHTYGEPEWTWCNMYAMATATFQCECGDTVTIIANVTVSIDAGIATIKAEAEFEGKTYTDEKTIDLTVEIDVDIPIATANGTDPAATSIYYANETASTLADLTRTTKELGFMLGDINGNDRIDANDALMAKRYSLGTLELDDEQKDRGDVNRDGINNLTDYNMIRRVVLQTYEIEQPEPVVTEGPSFADSALILIGADGKIISVNAEAGQPKNDTAIPEGGCIIAIPLTLFEANAEYIQPGIEITLTNAGAEDCANAEPDTPLTDASASFKAIIIPEIPEILGLFGE